MYGMLLRHEGSWSRLGYTCQFMPVYASLCQFMPVYASLCEDNIGNIFWIVLSIQSGTLSNWFYSCYKSFQITLKTFYYIILFPQTHCLKRQYNMVLYRHNGTPSQRLTHSRYTTCVWLKIPQKYNLKSERILKDNIVIKRTKRNMKFGWKLYKSDI